MTNNIMTVTGTALTWKASAGDYAITLASLANAAARQGAKGDLGATRAARYAVRVTLNMDVAPANGAVVEIWWSSSTSATAATDNTGGASGADAAYSGSAGGVVAQTKYQLQLIGVMAMTADADTVIQRAEFVFSPTQRYGMPVVVNLAGQALEGDDDSHQIQFVPLIDQIQ
jgi:hypothetical protein